MGKSSLVICADGGSNRLFDCLADTAEREQYLPACIVGDLDSVREEVKEFYVSRGVRLELHWN